MNYEDKHHPCVTLYQQFSALHFYNQKDGLPIQKNLQIFKIIVENIKHYRGEFGNSSAIISYVLEREGLISEEDYKQMNNDLKKTYFKKARDQYLAIAFLLGGTRSRYSHLVADLQNCYILGQDHYPQVIEEAYDMMLSYSPILGNVNTSNKTTKDLYTTGISFYQSANKNKNNDTSNEAISFVPGTSGRIFNDIKCYACNKMGHCAI